VKYLLIVTALLVGSQIPILADVIVPGTEIPVRTDTTIDVASWQRGRIYPAYVARDILGEDGRVVIPRGSEAELIVRRPAPGQMVVDLESIHINGKRYVMSTTGPEYNMAEGEFQNGTGLAGVITSGSEIRIPGESEITFRLQEPVGGVTWIYPGYQRKGMHYHPDATWYR